MLSIPSVLVFSGKKLSFPPSPLAVLGTKEVEEEEEEEEDSEISGCVWENPSLAAAAAATAAAAAAAATSNETPESCRESV